MKLIIFDLDQTLYGNPLRHTHATILLKGDVHPKIVSESLGHANIGITLDTYSYILPGLQERMVARSSDLASMGR